MHSIEKRPHSFSKYRGYASTGTIYRISKSNNKPGAVWWCAVSTDTYDVFHARTLREISKILETK